MVSTNLENLGNRELLGDYNLTGKVRELLEKLFRCPQSQRKLPTVADHVTPVCGLHCQSYFSFVILYGCVNSKSHIIMQEGTRVKDVTVSRPINILIEYIFCHVSGLIRCM